MRCNSCTDVLGPVLPEIILGGNSILIVGESPKGQLLECLQSPTFKKLDKNLHEVGINLSDCSFTEICKCELKNRSDLKRTGKNCIPNLVEQIKVLKPKLVITLGVISNELFASEYNIDSNMGDLIKVKDFDYLPLWHTSPINPSGFRRNKEILESLKSYFSGV